jgi:hypothetical protein
MAPVRRKLLPACNRELPRILIPRTWVNKPLYKRRRGDPLRAPLLLLWGLGPPAKPAWGSYIDPPRAYLLTRCGPPFYAGSLLPSQQLILPAA